MAAAREIGREHRPSWVPRVRIIPAGWTAAWIIVGIIAAGCTPGGHGVVATTPRSSRPRGAPTPAPTLPPAITGLSATATGPISVSLAWSSAGGAVDYFAILRDGSETGTVAADEPSLGSSPASPSGNPPSASPSSFTFEDKGLQPSTTYTYTVAAYRAGSAVAEATDTVRTKRPPPLASAKILGDWTVGGTWTSSSYRGGHYPGQHYSDSWAIGSDCSGGTCRLVLYDAFRIPLSRSGDAIHGSGQGPYDYCESRSNHVITDFTYDLKITAAKFFGDQWRATRFAGTERRYDAPQKGCSSFGGTLTLHGSLSA